MVRAISLAGFADGHARTTAGVPHPARDVRIATQRGRPTSPPPCSGSRRQARREGTVRCPEDEKGKSLPDDYDFPEVLPRDMRRFEWAWYAAAIPSAIVAIGMYDYSVVRVGGYAAALINVALFVIGFLLLDFAVHRASNIARISTIPFFLLVMLYDASHLAEEMDRFPMAWLAGARLLLMA